jgi:hypothetical protein
MDTEGSLPYSKGPLYNRILSRRNSFQAVMPHFLSLHSDLRPGLPSDFFIIFSKRAACSVHPILLDLTTLIMSVVILNYEVPHYDISFRNLRFPNSYIFYKNNIIPLKHEVNLRFNNIISSVPTWQITLLLYSKISWLIL